MPAATARKPKPKFTTDPSFELPDVYPGSWDYAVAHGDVKDTEDTDHPIATQGPYHSSSLFVTMAFVERVFRKVFGDGAAIQLDKLKAGDRVKTSAAEYWLAKR